MDYLIDNGFFNVSDLVVDPQQRRTLLIENLRPDHGGRLEMASLKSQVWLLLNRAEVCHVFCKILFHEDG